MRSNRGDAMPMRMMMHRHMNRSNKLPVGRRTRYNSINLPADATGDAEASANFVPRRLMSININGGS